LVPADFSNTTLITIPGTGTSGPATPYPSTINVSGLTGQQITKLQVLFHGLGHTSPDNIDAMLISPGGKKIFLMSDVGGGSDQSVNGLELTFADSGTALTTGKIAS